MKSYLINGLLVLLAAWVAAIFFAYWMLSAGPHFNKTAHKYPVLIEFREKMLPYFSRPYVF